MTFQDLILKLQHFWASQGCLIQQPLDVEVGAGTSHPETLLRVLGPTVPSVAEQAAGQLLDFFSGIAAYVQKNPNRADELLAPATRP